MNRNRLALYVFWEKDGEVRDYVTYYLKGLQEVARTVVLIANGGVNAAGLEKLETMGVEVLQRENHGLDFAAWKAALLQRGWDNVQTYDELILCNCSCYGPVYPFSEAFERMEQKECDFWGMTSHPERLDLNIIPDSKESVIYEHLQSYFLVFRNNAIISNAFHKWWKELTPMTSLDEEVAYHEVRFTKYLRDKGLSYSCLCDSDRYQLICYGSDATRLCAVELLTSDRMPLVKRKLFTDTKSWLYRRLDSWHPSSVLEYIEKSTSYDSKIIWRDLLATKRLSDIKDSLNLNYIIPNKTSDTIGNKNINRKVAAIFCLEREGRYDIVGAYINSLPDDADIIIFSSDNALRRKYEMAYKVSKPKLRCLKICSWNKLLVNNETLKVINENDYLCVLNDKSLAADGLSTDDLIRYFAEGCLHNKGYVGSVIELFEAHPLLGMLTPPTPIFGPFHMLGNETSNKYKKLQKLYEISGLKCPMDSHAPVPIGLNMWIRCQPLKACLKKLGVLMGNNKNTADILCSIEVFLPHALQDETYYTAWCSPISLARHYMNELSNKYREYNKCLFDTYGFNSWIRMWQFLLARKPAVSNAVLINELKTFKLTVKLKDKKRKYRIMNFLTLGLTYLYNKKRIQKWVEQKGI